MPSQQRQFRSKHRKIPQNLFLHWIWKCLNSALSVGQVAGWKKDSPNTVQEGGGKSCTRWGLNPRYQLPSLVTLPTKHGYSRDDNLTLYQVFYSVMNRTIEIYICDTDMAVIFRVFDESQESLGFFFYLIFWYVSGTVMINCEKYTYCRWYVRISWTVTKF